MANLVYQCFLFSNKMHEWVLVSSDTIKKYADKVGADYNFSTTVQMPGLNKFNPMHRYFNILNIIYNDWFDQYDDILYVDCDVIADSEADNIFEIPKAKHLDVIAISEKHVNGGDYSPGFHINHKIKKDFIDLYNNYGIDVFHNGKRKEILQYNTGVVLFTKKGRKKFRKNVPYDEWINWVNSNGNSSYLGNDQPFLNFVFEKYKFNVKDIDDKWNMPATWFRTNPCPKSHFYHFSGGDSKMFISDFSYEVSPAGHSFDLRK
jgi:lipopolysaccharide biosynthesis glycosyltransferase